MRAGRDERSSVSPGPSDTPAIRIEPLDNRRDEIAHEIRGVLLAASAQEAALLGIANRPLRASIDEIRAPGPRYLGARDAGARLCGWISLERGRRSGDDEGIVSLVVDPARQRRGIATALLRAALEQVAPGGLRVSTPALNHPALALYQRCGFTETARAHAAGASLEVVLLRHPGGCGMP